MLSVWASGGYYLVLSKHVCVTLNLCLCCQAEQQRCGRGTHVHPDGDSPGAAAHPVRGTPALGEGRRRRVRQEGENSLRGVLSSDH